MRTEHRHREVDVGPARAGVFQPTGAVAMTTSDDYTSFAVKIEPRALENAVEEILGRPVPRPLQLGPSLDLGAGHGAGRARLVRFLAAQSGPDGLAGSEIVAAPLREAVVHGLLRAVDHRYRDELDAPVPSFAPRALRRVVDAVQADPAHEFTLANMAAIAMGERAHPAGDVPAAPRHHPHRSPPPGPARPRPPGAPDGRPRGDDGQPRRPTVGLSPHRPLRGGLPRPVWRAALGGRSRGRGPSALSVPDPARNGSTRAHPRRLTGGMSSAAGPEARPADLRPGISLRAAAPGRLDDAAAFCLGTAVDEALDRHPWGVVLDLSEVDEVTPAGLAMLVRVAVRAGALDVGLCPVCSSAVRSVIAGAGLRELFDLHDSIGEALAALGVTR